MQAEDYMPGTTLCGCIQQVTLGILHLAVLENVQHNWFRSWLQSEWLLSIKGRRN